MTEAVHNCPAWTVSTPSPFCSLSLFVTTAQMSPHAHLARVSRLSTPSNSTTTTATPERSCFFFVHRSNCALETRLLPRLFCLVLCLGLSTILFDCRYTNGSQRKQQKPCNDVRDTTKRDTNIKPTMDIWNKDDTPTMAVHAVGLPCPPSFGVARYTLTFLSNYK